MGMGRFGWLFGLVELVGGWGLGRSWGRDGWMDACFSVFDSVDFGLLALDIRG